METIRSRYASRINGTYNNEGVTDTFKSLGLYNNNTSTLDASNNANATVAAPAATFIARRGEPQRLMTISEALERARRFN
jgi:hypothetical protein